MMFSVCYAICVLSDRLPNTVKAMISSMSKTNRLPGIVIFRILEH